MARFLLIFTLLTVVVTVYGKPKPDSTTPKPISGNVPFNLTFVLSGSNIPSQDDHSEVDAFVKLYSKTGKDGEDERFGTTNHVLDNANPEWHQVFWFLWEKGTEQKFHFVLRDHDVLDRDDDVGEVTIDVDEYVAKGQEINASLSMGGYLIVKKTQPTSFRLHAKDIPRLDRLEGKSDAYVEVYWRRGKNGTDIGPFATTSVKDNEDNPDWNDEIIEFSNWQKGTDQYLYFKVYDADTLSAHDVVGDLFLEVDPFAVQRVAKTSRLQHQEGDAKATLTVTPV